MKVRAILLFILLALSCRAPGVGGSRIQPGDIVFQASQSPQSQAIQLATHSPYSHMGLIFFRKGQPYVLEALGQVKVTALSEWAARGEGGTYVVKQLKDRSILAAPGSLERLEQEALSFEGLPYDPYFEWSDERIYCSELVWKAYDRGLGIQLGQLAPLSSFDLSSLIVSQKLVQRFGDRIPLDAEVISPEAIFSSPLLVEK